MAATTRPIVWDFYRHPSSGNNTGFVAHQYDTKEQSIYLKNGLRTRIGQVPEGHWSESLLSQEQSISSEQYELTAWDQPFQNLLAGAAVLNGDLYYVRYDWITTMLTDQDPGGE